MAELKGIYPILATPFQSSGELDENSFERLIEFLVVSGVQGLTLLAMPPFFLSPDPTFDL